MPKTKFIFSIFLLTVFQISFAQIRFGTRASVSITNLTKAHSISKSRTGFQIGALGLIPLDMKDQFFFVPEIQYSMQGEYNVHEPKDTDDYPEEKDIKTFSGFINTPLFLRFYLSSLENDFFFEGGPYLGFLVNENIERIENTEPYDEEMKSFDLGLGLGVGYSFNRQFELSIRYYYGFPDQVKNDAADTANHNSVLNFGLSYIFY
jgi:hypothetical protein